MSSCCTPDGSCNTDKATETSTATVVADGHTTVYKVNGVGSAHCQSVVAKAIGGLDNVISVDVEIGTGLVTITTGGAPDDDLIAKTIGEAGYEYAGRA
ncbi:copper chaperone [Streptomyces sp. V4I23]|uniref:heavy-metal-associated domain-containing protein n=1 Tax=Streptomyces sp. V4I23 TaxID=3042282 RepID=UPI002784015A|nr:heavy-metal-associated domain-containing protein [Streptomyces sp. V4I23]MDQ1007375.1 copper chaperone [Streptomyces sp. V4I23]